jgi:hypothetical protein
MRAAVAASLATALLCITALRCQARCSHSTTRGRRARQPRSTRWMCAIYNARARANNVQHRHRREATATSAAAQLSSVARAAAARRKAPWQRSAAAARRHGRQRARCGGTAAAPSAHCQGDAQPAAGSPPAGAARIRGAGATSLINNRAPPPALSPCSRDPPGRSGCRAPAGRSCCSSPGPASRWRCRARTRTAGPRCR